MCVLEQGFVLRWGLRCGAYWRGRAHPLPPIAPVTTGANGDKGCGQNHHLMRRAEKGAAMATTGCERRKRVRACTGRSKLPLPLANTAKHPPAHPFTPSAPVTTGANGGKGCGRGHSQVRTAGTGASAHLQIGPSCADWNQRSWFVAWCECCFPHSSDWSFRLRPGPGSVDPWPFKNSYSPLTQHGLDRMRANPRSRPNAANWSESDGAPTPVLLIGRN